MLLQNLIVATLMVCLTTCIHFFGLTGLIALIRRDHFRSRTMSSIWLQSGAILAVIMVLFFLHTLEIWAFAILYYLLGQFQTFEAALYFSTSAFTTVGFGELILDENWRLLSAIEAAAGFLLIGWSTAFLVSITAKLRLLEALIEPPKTENATKNEKEH